MNLLSMGQDSERKSRRRVNSSQWSGVSETAEELGSAEVVEENVSGT